MSLSITCTATSRLPEARLCAERCGLALSEGASVVAGYELVFSADDVRLRSNSREHGDVLVDFCGGSAAHRRKFGGGKGQMIAKAVGIKGSVRPAVYDLTAGLGGDAFVLAALGCKVTLFERNPVVYALLVDGLRRAADFGRQQDAELLAVVERMQVLSADSIEWLRYADERPPVIYLDPMFPERRKSASVKKEMQAFHEIVGKDPDATVLLQAALDVAANRVVVKRPRNAPSVGDCEPSYKLEGKSSRYDVYALKKLDV